MENFGQMKIVTYNVMLGGVHASSWESTQDRLPKVMNVIKKLNPDILGLQETLARRTEKNAINCVVSEIRKEKCYSFEKVFCCDDSWTKGTGCSLFSKTKPVTSRIIGERVKAVEMVFPGNVSICNVYLSHVDEKERLPQIKEILKELSGRNYCVIMGDFNALSPEDEISNEVVKKLKNNERMKEKYFKGEQICHDTINAVLDEGYTDVALQYYSPREMTDMTKLAKENNKDEMPPARIDYFFITPKLKTFITDFEFHKEEFVQDASDHFPWEMRLNDELFE